MLKKAVVLFFAAVLALALDFSPAWANRAPAGRGKTGFSSPWAPSVQNLLKSSDYDLFPFLDPLSSRGFDSPEGRQVVESVLRKLEAKGSPDSLPKDSDAEDLVLEALQDAVAEKWSEDYALKKSQDSIKGAAKSWLKEGALGSGSGDLRPIDHNGDRMRGLLNDLKEAPVNGSVKLDFIPGPASLKIMGNMGWETDINREFEVFLYRDKATKQWGMVKGKSDGVSDLGADADIDIHNHPLQRPGSLPYPSPRDLIASAGKAARFFVISREGAVEWSPSIPYPDDPTGFLPKDPSEKERDEWLRQFDGTLSRKILQEIFPSAFLRSIGVQFVMRSWSQVLQSSLF